MVNKKQASTNIEKKIKFNKSQILSSSKFSFIEKDVLKVLLEDNEYTFEEAKEILDNFKNKEAE